MRSACLALGMAAAVLWAGAAQAARYAAIVVEAATGKVLHEEDADESRYPASLTKLMTLHLAFDALKAGRLKLEQRLPVSGHAAAQPPSSLGLNEGERIAVEEAILAAVTKSANDAAVVLAEAIGGTESEFARQMTARARALGMDDTVFRNASGLPDPEQRTTARDMAKLGMALLRNHPDRYHYFSAADFSWKSRVFANHNRLLERFEGADGLKTGFIRASGFNLVASAERDGRRLVGVVLGGVTGAQRDKRMAALLEDGFGDRPGAAIASLRVPSLIGRAEAAPVKPPAKPAASSTDWGIQVGAFVRESSARKQIATAVAAAPKLLRDEEASVVRAREGRKQMYRARLMGMDEREARAACATLKKRKLVCTVVAPAA